MTQRENQLIRAFTDNLEEKRRIAAQEVTPTAAAPTVVAHTVMPTTTD